MFNEHDHTDQATAFQSYQATLFRLAPQMGAEADNVRAFLSSLGVQSELGFRRAIRERGLQTVLDQLTVETVARAVPNAGLMLSILRAAARFIAREQVAAN
jgi:hypothetical protein